jgi:hypothetical protein
MYVVTASNKGRGATAEQQNPANPAKNASTTNKNTQNQTSSMPKPQQRTIDEILNILNPAQRETTQNLRTLIKTAVPETVELVKQGKITYKLGDNDFVWITQTKKHMDLEFAMGASLDSNQLKTRGTAEQNENTRHITVTNFTAQKTELTRLLKQAATTSPHHCPTPQKP